MIIQRIPADLILNSEVIHQNGSLKRVRYWLRGWINLGINCHWIQGYTGKETMVDVDEIRPVVLIDIL